MIYNCYRFLFIFILFSLSSCDMCSHTSEKKECEIIETEDNNIESKNGQRSSLSMVGLPQIIDTISSTILNRSSYTVSYNPTTRLPNWVMWHLSAEHTDGPLKRLNNFHEDEDCPLPRATLHCLVPHCKTIEAVAGREVICVLQVITSGTIRRCMTRSHW